MSCGADSALPPLSWQLNNEICRMRFFSDSKRLVKRSAEFPSPGTFNKSNCFLPTRCCNQRLWHSRCLSSPKPCLAEVPISAELSVQMRMGTSRPASLKSACWPRPTPAARTTPYYSASPLLGTRLAWANDQNLVPCEPIIMHHPEVDLRVLTHPAKYFDGARRLKRETEHHPRA